MLLWRDVCSLYVLQQCKLITLMVITDQCQAKNVLKLFQPTYPFFQDMKMEPQNIFSCASLKTNYFVRGMSLSVTLITPTCFLEFI